MCPIIPEDVEATSGERMRWLVNTHADLDHIACNGAWADMGATVVAHETVRDAMGERHGRPEVTFSDRYTLEGDRNEAQLEWVAAPTPPRTRWFTSRGPACCTSDDLFLWGLIPLARITDERLRRLREVMERILSYDADTLVCGHGPVFTPDHVRRFLTYLDDLLARVPAMARDGLSAEAIAGAFPAPEDMSRLVALPRVEAPPQHRPPPLRRPLSRFRHQPPTDPSTPGRHPR